MRRSCGLRWLGACLPLLALALAAPHAHAAGGQAEIEAGVAAYAAGSLDSARTAFGRAVRLEPHNFTALRWLARVESDLGEDARGEDQRELFAHAVEHARSAVQAAPDSARGHLELAVALGRQALREGPRTKLALSREIKSEVDRALALDAGLGIAWHVLAMCNVKLSSLNGFERMAANAVLGGVPRVASYENAEQAFEKAVFFF